MGSFHRFVVGVGGAAFYNFTAGGSADFISRRSLEHLAAPRPAREACSSAAPCHRAFSGDGIGDAHDQIEPARMLLDQTLNIEALEPHRLGDGIARTRRRNH